MNPRLGLPPLRIPAIVVVAWQGIVGTLTALRASRWRRSVEWQCLITCMVMTQVGIATAQGTQQLSHDPGDRLKRLLQVDGALQTFAYDAAGNLSTVRRESRPQWIVSPINGHRYALVRCGDWLQCEAWAVTQGGHLATVRSADENAWIVSTFRLADTITGYWIGLNDLNLKGQYLWASGEPVVYLNWSPGEPNNNCEGLPEDFVHLWGNAAPVGTWNDFRLVSCVARLPTITQGVVELN